MQTDLTVTTKFEEEMPVNKIKHNDFMETKILSYK